MVFGPAMYGLEPAPKVCDYCQRDETQTRFVNDHKSCSECFGQWYDPDNSSFDHLSRDGIGNYVRRKNGLPALETV